MRLEDFKKGMRVKYIPTNADGNPDHPDCKGGVVSFRNGESIFVIYDNAVVKMITGDEPYCAAATRPEDLIKDN